ncbi:hypothetical protein H6S82_00200 [Planktothrix sp. FACHB-1355]|uniref:Uncharacterized protein n=1 Tax=Aerosakkonema funiforme FACHB-1375 TaxID=2949571 RepID=A0A926VFW5_9CYAN|nr:MULTISPECIES: hypothetical protein [Oscillatoriales]MBD2181874.1 hypothetical protein [Aerosakkonema funiforme FACHB-1375]MBD3557294.1 hypothetical protein [Planktothrix sp. FACHB-1355]
MNKLLVFKPNITLRDLSDPYYYGPFYTSYAFAYEDNDYYYALPGKVKLNALPRTEKKTSRYPTLEDWIKEHFKATDIRLSKHQPGQFYKRMWHPPDYLPRKKLISNPEGFTQSLIVIELLIRKMQELFLTVEPCRKNLFSFGHKIRELLLLACMEVETSWVGILKEHEYTKNRYKTNDYVKLLEPMCLANYELALRWYPNFPSFKPFSCWNVNRPTKSLYWYDAYNATKHDREAHLNRATLLNAVHAVGAVVVMFSAQYGIEQNESLFNIINSAFVIDFEYCPERFYIPFRRENVSSSLEFSEAKYSF